MLSLKEITIVSDTEDIDRSQTTIREIHARAEDVGPIHIYVSIDRSYPHQGYAYLALWSYKGWQRLVHVPGERLVTPHARAPHLKDARPTQEIIDGLVEVAGGMLGEGGL